MKIARTLGLAALALALMASFAAGSAVATPTALCKTGTVEPYCATGNQYPAKTSFGAATSSVKIKTSVLEVTCTASTLKGETTAESGTPLSVAIGTLTFSSCNGGECTVTGTPAAGSIAWTQGMDGTLSLGESTAYVKCGKIIDCTYHLPSLNVSSGRFFSWVESALTKVGGVFCPATAKVKPTTYENTSVYNLFVTRAEPPPAKTTGLCDSIVELYCEPAHLYPKGTVLSGSATDFKITPDSYVFGSLTCKEASMSTKTTAAYGEPLGVEGTEFSQLNCGFVGAPGCVVKASPYKGSIARSEADGLWQGGELDFHVECEKVIDCHYTVANGSTIRIAHGDPAAVQITKLPLAVSGTFCPASASLSATYTLSSPSGPLFFTDVLR